MALCQPGRHDEAVIPRSTVAHVAASALGAPSRCGAVRVVCIDGPAGSGKTSVASALSAELGQAPVVHLDDLYDGWDQDLGDALAERLAAWLLDAWQVGLPGRHLRFDWLAGRYAAWEEVPPAPVVILEGCGSASRTVRARSCCVVWVEAAPDLRLARGLARDGVALEKHWRTWMAREDAHFAAEGTRSAADVVIDGSTGRVVGT